MLPCYYAYLHTMFMLYTDHTHCSAHAYVISWLMYFAMGTSGKVPIVCHCE